jgi:hypothetical protein
MVLLKIITINTDIGNGWYCSGHGIGTYDFRDNEEVAWEDDGKYSTPLHTAAAQDIAREHGPNGQYSDTPFFLYFSYQVQSIQFSSIIWIKFSSVQFS